MAFDFPASPTTGTLYQPAGGPTYRYNGAVWSVLAGQFQGAMPSDSAPANPVPGQLWWESDTGSLFVYFDDGNSQQWVQITPGIAPPVVTPWVSYPAVATGFGTTASMQAWSRRIGDTLHVKGRFGSGTPTAVEARISIGYNGVDGNVTASASKVSSLEPAGICLPSFATASSFYMLRETGKNYLTFGVQNATTIGYAKANGTGVANSGNTVGWMAEVSIEGWLTNV
jgi:hypothetical protein